MRNVIKTALFVSAFSPALISLGIARLFTAATVWDGVYYIFFGVFGCLTVVYIVAAIKWYGESFPIQVKKVESYDALMLGIVATYVVPFFVKSADLTVWSIGALFMILSIFSFICDATIPSPLMRIQRFRFYKVESANGMVYTLISTKEIIDPSQVKAVKKISGSMLLEDNK